MRLLSVEKRSAFKLSKKYPKNQPKGVKGSEKSHNKPHKPDYFSPGIWRKIGTNEYPFFAEKSREPWKA
jgi:hypothetical protein